MADEKLARMNRVKERYDRIVVIISPARCGSTPLARVFWEHPALRYYSHEPFEVTYFDGEPYGSGGSYFDFACYGECGHYDPGEAYGMCERYDPGKGEFERSFYRVFGGCFGFRAFVAYVGTFGYCVEGTNG